MFPLVLAHLVFWIVLLLGHSEIGARRSAVFAALWVTGYFVSGHLPAGAPVFASSVAVLDIVLVLMVFQGDLRLR